MADYKETQAAWVRGQCIEDKKGTHLSLVTYSDNNRNLGLITDLN